LAASFQRIDPLLDPEWDLLIAQHPNASIFHTSHWARVLSETYGFTPEYYFRNAEGTAEAICLMGIDSWLRGRRGKSLPFSDRCEPLLSAGSDFGSLVEFLRSVGQAKGWKSIELRGVPLGIEKASTAFYEHTLQVGPDSASLFEGLEGSVRRAIRKAEKSGLRVSIENGLDAIRSYYELHCLTRKKHGMPPQPFLFFKNIYLHLLAEGFGFVALAKLDGQAIAGAIYFTAGKKAVYKFGASNSQMDSLRPSNLVMWKAIEHLAKSGCAVLDFGRTSMFAEGLRRYKLGWGTKENPLYYLKFNPKTGRYFSEPDRSEGKHSTVFRRLPVWVLKQIGKHLYRHAG
jgi:hypothetical protein